MPNPSSADDDRFQLLADALPQLVWTADSDGVVDYYNARRSAYAGATSVVDVHDWQPLVHPDDLDQTLAAWEAASQRGEEYECEHRMQMADGSWRWHLSRAIPVPSADGTIVKWFGTATDVHERKLVEQQLASTAHILQHALLPAAPPNVPGWSIAWAYRAAEHHAEVGGDWYDAVIGDGTMTIIVGDVAGHGVEAAAVMGAARHAIATPASADDSPREVLRRANRYLSKFETVMVTCVVMHVDIATGRAVVSCAGHPPPLVVSPEQALQFVDVRPGRPLGVTTDATYDEVAVDVGYGDTCVLYTDGLVERRDESFDDGLRRLERGVATLAADLVRDPDRLIDVTGTDRRDDVALIVAQRESSAS